MAMDGTVLGTLIWNHIKENVVNGSAEDNEGKAKWITIATDIVTHIQTLGVVHTTGPSLIAGPTPNLGVGAIT